VNTKHLSLADKAVACHLIPNMTWSIAGVGDAAPACAQTTAASIQVPAGTAQCAYSSHLTTAISMLWRGLHFCYGFAWHQAPMQARLYRNCIFSALSGDNTPTWSGQATALLPVQAEHGLCPAMSAQAAPSTTVPSQVRQQDLTTGNLGDAHAVQALDLGGHISAGGTSTWDW